MDQLRFGYGDVDCLASHCLVHHGCPYRVRDKICGKEIGIGYNCYCTVAKAGRHDNMK